MAENYNPNLLGTPQGYATPDQIKSMYDYSQALLKDSQRPIQHWTQGLQSIVSALVGGNQSYLANQKKNEADAVLSGRLMPDTSGKPAEAPKTFSEGTAPGPKMADASPSADGSQPRGYRNNNPLNIESGDFTKRQPGYAGSDGRFAKFDSMDSGTKAADTLLTSYDKRGINTVGSVIARWAPAADGNNVSAYVANVSKQLGIDPNAPLTPEMRPKLIAAMAQHENGRPMPAAGDANTTMAAALTGQPAPAPASAAIDKAASGPQMAQTVAAGPKPAPTNLSAKPDPQGMGIYIDPRLVPRRPQLNEGQVRGMLADPQLTIQEKMAIRQEYINKDAPIDVPYPGGVVRIDPRNPTVQQFIPEGKWIKNKAGDIETETFSTPQPNQSVQPYKVLPPPGTTTGPRSEAAPDAPGGAVAPAAAPQGGSPAPAIPPAAVAANAPAAPAAAPEAVPNTGGVQVASLDPSAGVSAAAKAAASAEPAAPDTPLAKWAQATPPGQPPAEVDPILEKLKMNNFPQTMIDDYVAKKAYDNAQALKMKKGEADIEVQKEAEKKTNEAAAKRYDEYIATIAPATDQRQNISMARAAADDPNFYSGSGDALVEGFKKIKSALGIDPDAAAPMEVFRKTTAQSIMSGLKTAFGGLGQIRVAEIELQKTANASTNNSPTAVRALLAITDRNAQKIEEIGSMATAYKAGAAVMDPKNPDKVLIPANKPGPDGEPMERPGVDAKFERVLQQWRKANPTFTPEEEKSLLHSLKDTKGEGAPKAEMGAEDKRALDWATANPKDPMAAEIKKRLGVK